MAIVYTSRFVWFSQMGSSFTYIHSFVARFLITISYIHLLNVEVSKILGWSTEKHRRRVKKGARSKNADMCNQKRGRIGWRKSYNKNTVFREGFQAGIGSSSDHSPRCAIVFPGVSLLPLAPRKRLTESLPPDLLNPPKRTLDEEVG